VSARRSLPPYDPQLALLAKSAPAGDGWLHEVKFDGFRIGAAVEHGRQLVAERLAAAGRHDREDILAGQHRGHDLALARAEAVVAEDAFQRRGRPPHVAGHRRSLMPA